MREAVTTSIEDSGMRSSTANQTPNVPLTLASASPRRAWLLEKHGYAVTIVTPPMEEPCDLPASLSPGQQAEAISFFKASSVSVISPTRLVLAGDTLVAQGGRLFGKPADRNEARDSLSALAGTSHQVITGLTLLDPLTTDRLIRHEVTTVTMRTMPPARIEAYLDSGDWRGKAGAYGIQDHGDEFVERIDGSFTNVVGLPMELLAKMLAAWFTRGGMADEAHPSSRGLPHHEIS